MFFGNSKLRFFKIGWLNCGQSGKNQYKKKTQSTKFSDQSVKVTFILLNCHRFIDNSNDFYLFILS